MRRFHFERIKDVSGTSGCGNVADGVVFDDGQVVVHWLGEHSSVNVYHSLCDVEWIHGHQGSTKIVFDDPDDKMTPQKEEAKRNGN